MIIRTCPKCGGDLQHLVITTYPPIYEWKCLKCGWKYEQKDTIQRMPLMSNTRFKKITENESALTDFILNHDLHFYRHCQTDEMAEACKTEIINDTQCRNCWIKWLRQEANRC